MLRGAVVALDETIYQFFARRWRRFTGRTRGASRSVADDGRATDVVALGPRLRILANAVALREIELCFHEGPLVIAPERLWLPRRQGLLPTRAENDRLTVLTTTFAAAAVRRDLAAQPLLEGRRAWYVSALALERALADELPGWAAQRGELAPALLATRPALTSMSGTSALLEAVIQHRLGRTLTELSSQCNVDVESVRRACLADDSDEALDVDVLGSDAIDTLAGVPWWGRIAAADEVALHGNPVTDASSPPSAVTTQHTSRPRTVQRRRKLDEPVAPENPLTHSFEKVHTAEEHSGGNKHADGSDELDEHGDALDELELDEVVLSNERTSSIYRADLTLLAGATPGDAATTGICYDEWDAARGRYLARHCRVHIEQPVSDALAGAALRSRVQHQHRRALWRLRDELRRVETALRWSFRQPDGPEVDVDATVDRLAGLRAGHDGGERLYARRRRRGHDVAVLMLIDASLSTDAWVANRRVLDTARDGVTLLRLVLEHHVTEVAMAGFCSYTHEDCRFIALEGFDEDAATGLARLAGLRPAGYTRIGPALRHGFEVLLRARAPRRMIVLVTDAKPTDTDHYEGRHGIGDVRQALREGQRLGLQTFALAIDPAAASHLPAMFGPRGFAGLPSVDALAVAGAKLFTALRRC